MPDPTGHNRPVSRNRAYLPSGLKSQAKGRREFVSYRGQLDRGSRCPQHIFDDLAPLHSEPDGTVEAQRSTSRRRIFGRAIDSSISEQDDSEGSVDVRGQPTHRLAKQPRTLKRIVTRVVLNAVGSRIEAGHTVVSADEKMGQVSG